MVKPVKKQDTLRTKQDTKFKVDVTALDVSVSNIKKLRKSAMIINCENKKNRKKFKANADKVLKKKNKVVTMNSLNPMVKLFRVRKIKKTEDKIIVNKTVAQNKITKSDSFEIKILAKKFNKDYNDTTLLLQVVSESHQALLSIQKLRCEFEIVKIEDYICVLRCFRCYGYAHKAQNCRNTAIGPNCRRKDHLYGACIS